MISNDGPFICKLPQLYPPLLIADPAYLSKALPLRLSNHEFHWANLSVLQRVPQGMREHIKHVTLSLDITTDSGSLSNIDFQYRQKSHVKVTGQLLELLPNLKSLKLHLDFTRAPKAYQTDEDTMSEIMPYIKPFRNKLQFRLVCKGLGAGDVKFMTMLRDRLGGEAELVQPSSFMWRNAWWSDAYSSSWHRTSVLEDGAYEVWLSTRPKELDSIKSVG